MTRQRKLAIQMWEEIALALEIKGSINMADYKARFCEEEGVDWGGDCYMCHYIPSCSKCPIKDKAYLCIRAENGDAQAAYEIAHIIREGK